MLQHMIDKMQYFLAQDEYPFSSVLFIRLIPLTEVVTVSLLAEGYAGKVIVCKADVEPLSSTAEQYGVTAVQTALIIKNGEEVIGLAGVRPGAKFVTLPETKVRQG